MGFIDALRLADGDEAGEAEFGYQPQAGDEIRIAGNQKMLVRAVIPVEVAAEFVRGAVFGVLEVELEVARSSPGENRGECRSRSA